MTAWAGLLPQKLALVVKERKCSLSCREEGRAEPLDSRPASSGRNKRKDPSERAQNGATAATADGPVGAGSEVTEFCRHCVFGVA